MDKDERLLVKGFSFAARATGPALPATVFRPVVFLPVCSVKRRSGRRFVCSADEKAPDGPDKYWVLLARLLTALLSQLARPHPCGYYLGGVFRARSSRRASVVTGNNCPG